MALNVRFLQKAGVAPADAVTGVGLNTIAGAITHAVPSPRRFESERTC